MSRSRAFTLGLFALFCMAMMASLLFGVQVYRAIADERAHTDAARVAQGTLLNAVRAGDAADSISIGEYEGNDMLLIAQTGAGDDYLTRVFVHDGQLMQQYATAEAPLDPAAAHALFPTESFSAVCGEDGLLTLRTDAGETVVALRCAQPQLAAEAASDGAAGAEGELR